MNYRLTLFIVLTVLSASTAIGQQRKLENLPYVDHRILHFGFSVGLHTQDMNIINSGFITPEGKSWYAEVPHFSPGFCVGLVSDICLGSHFNLRFTPTMYFGNKTLVMREYQSEKRISQDIKSNYLTFPFSIKYNSKRINNYRPYLIGGISPSIDISKRTNDYIRTLPFDTYIEIGFGCDLYLAYFKLIPELKFSFGLADIIDHKRTDLKNPADIVYTQGFARAGSRLITLSFYFE